MLYSNARYVCSKLTQATLETCWNTLKRKPGLSRLAAESKGTPYSQKQKHHTVLIPDSFCRDWGMLWLQEYSPKIRSLALSNRRRICEPTTSTEETMLQPEGDETNEMETQSRKDQPCFASCCHSGSKRCNDDRWQQQSAPCYESRLMQVRRITERSMVKNPAHGYRLSPILHRKSEKCWESQRPVFTTSSTRQGWKQYRLAIACGFLAIPLMYGMQIRAIIAMLRIVNATD